MHIKNPGPMLLILFFMLGSGAISACALTGTVAVYVGWTFICLIALAMFSMFASVLFKGLGENRDVATVSIISVVGVLALISHFGVLFRWTGFQLASSGVRSESLLDALYFSVVTWTTLGYGDFIPMPEARYIVVVEAIMGYVMMALLISVFVASIAKAR